ncbi:hypothetical protein HH310_11190 [Actinoplanes sp. TBRC 11911]|uniref:CU044_2847 family protein n=1 Tax=Actinoplanes sp. TBRC 11911 TaxID=2729386 RepID=UPI00145D24E3|nr:CU044_2847 family protein [Actinoplanes sp. TBRC 11911]NMO51755.1 hypothetical protein [Actinoplanes sp. TBRC 11911]
MGQLVEFELDGGDGRVLVELAPGVGGVVTRGLGGGGVVARAGQSFEAAVRQVQPVAQTIVNELRAAADSPAEITVEFGLDMHAEAGAFVAAASTTANFKVAVTWRRRS